MKLLKTISFKFANTLLSIATNLEGYSHTIKKKFPVDRYRLARECLNYFELFYPNITRVSRYSEGGIYSIAFDSQNADTEIGTITIAASLNTIIKNKECVGVAVILCILNDKYPPRFLDVEIPMLSEIELKDCRIADRLNVIDSRLRNNLCQKDYDFITGVNQ